ncbi:unnamed protein product [Calicophoron daubneyi]|uniref:Uncharacterized protein n=1 Tax=Calicophoron daubneyi TaxID=300641 RepID=A0AAV2TJH5_CALDB
MDSNNKHVCVARNNGVGATFSPAGVDEPNGLEDEHEIESACSPAEQKQSKGEKSDTSDGSCNSARSTIQKDLLKLLLSDFLCCSVCSNRTGDMRILPCLHAACVECIPYMWKMPEGESEHEPECRVCQAVGLEICREELQSKNDPEFVLISSKNEKEFPVDEGEIEEIQPNSTSIEKANHATEAMFIKALRNLSQLINEDVEHDCDYCRFESQYSLAEYRCVECGDNLCRPCAGAHRRTKLTRLHTLLPYGEILISTCLPRIHQAPPPQCMDHILYCSASVRSEENDEKMAMNTSSPRSTNSTQPPVSEPEIGWLSPPACAYCRECEKLLCAECCGKFSSSVGNQNHKDHTVLPLETAVQEVRTELDRYTNKLLRRRTLFKDYLSHLADYGQELTSFSLNLGKQVDGRAQELHREIDTLAEKFKKEAASEIEKELKKLSQYIHPLGPLLAQCEVAGRFSNAIIQHGRPDELLQSSKLVLQRLKSLCKAKFQQLPARLRPTFRAGEYKCCTTPTPELLLGHNDQGYLFGFLDFQRDEEKKLGLDSVNGNGENSKTEEDTCCQFGYTSTGVNTSPRQTGEARVQDWDLMGSYELYANCAQTNGADALLSSRSVQNDKKRLLTREFEFDARFTSDSRDVWPTGVAVNQSTSQIYVVDRDNSRIKVKSEIVIFREDGGFISSIGDAGAESGCLVSPFDITIAPTGTILVSDYQLEQVMMYTLDGIHRGSLSTEKLKHPRGVAHGLGLTAVVESRRHQIVLYDMRKDSKAVVRRIPTDEAIRDAAQHANSMKFALVEPYYVEFLQQGSGYIAVTDWAAPSLKLFSVSTGACVLMTGGYGKGLDQMLQPYGICFAPWTQQLLIADHVNHRIQSTQVLLSSELDEVAEKQSIGVGSYASMQHVTGCDYLGTLKPVADKVTNSVWHPMAVGVDVRRQRIIISEALGNIKVLRTL